MEELSIIYTYLVPESRESLVQYLPQYLHVLTQIQYSVG